MNSTLAPRYLGLIPLLQSVQKHGIFRLSMRIGFSEDQFGLSAAGELTPSRLSHNHEPSIKGMGFPKTAFPG